MRYRFVISLFALITVLAIQLTTLAGPKPKLGNDEVRFSVVVHNGKSVLSIEFGEANLLVNDAVVVLEEGKEGKIGVSKNGNVEFKAKGIAMEAKIITTKMTGGLLQ